VQQDMVGYADGINLYAFVRNSPVVYTDPEGKFPFVGGFGASGIGWPIRPGCVSLCVFYGDTSSSQPFNSSPNNAIDFTLCIKKAEGAHFWAVQSKNNAAASQACSDLYNCYMIYW